MNAASLLVIDSSTAGNYDPSSVPLRELARIRGAMWSVRGPWRFGPRPLSPDNITALEFLPEYGNPLDASVLSAEQTAMLKTYTDLGHTHCCIGPPDGTSYHNQYPSTNLLASPATFEIFLDWLQVLWNHGLAPIVFLHLDGATFEETFALWDPLLRTNARAQRLMRIVVPSGWEPSGYDWSSKTWALYFAWARDVLPNALVLMHNACKGDGLPYDAPVGTDALYDDNGKPIGEAWARVTPNLHGWLLQDGAYDWAPKDSPAGDQGAGFAAQFRSDSVGADAHSFAWHFATGAVGWPTMSAWGNEPLKIYNGECTAFAAYWSNLPYAVCCEWGDLAVANGACGYLDGGTVNIGGDIPPPWVRK